MSLGSDGHALQFIERFHLLSSVQYIYTELHILIYILDLVQTIFINESIPMYNNSFKNKLEQGQGVRSVKRVNLYETLKMISI